MENKTTTNKIWLSSPTMHDNEELKYIKEAYDSNWITTIGENINKCEEKVSELLNIKYALGLSNGTAAVHLGIKLAAEEIYGKQKSCSLSLQGKKVFCSDLTFAATCNPVVYEGGEPIFIDSEYNTWNMDPLSLEQAFTIYPDVKIIVLAHLYGVPAQMDEIKKIADKHKAIIVEDAAESLGATYKNQQMGTFGNYNIISFNGNKIITGSSGGMLLTNNKEAYTKVKKWSTQSREDAPWYLHEELGYNYRMSNIIAGIIRGQLSHLDEHVRKKSEIYKRYKNKLDNLPIEMNPYLNDVSHPNFWLSCLTINKDYLCEHKRTNKTYSYKSEKGKTCPDEIIEMLAKHNIEARPIWNPMHNHPYYKNCDFVSYNNQNVSEDIFDRGVCLPSDIKITPEEQNKVINIIKNCFE